MDDFSPDDTQPFSPIKTPPSTPRVTIDPEAEDVRGGPGCLMWAVGGVAALGFALVIIGLAAVAGWKTGQTTAETNATATQNFRIDEQLSHIQDDVRSGNQVLLAARLQYLSTLTPGVPGLGDIMQTATSVYLTNQPTATFTPTASPQATVTDKATEAVEFIATASGGGFDLPGLLAEAQQDISLRDWDGAIEALDIILAADEDFESNTVRTLMNQVLVEKANQLLLSPELGDLAEGVILTDRAREFGSVDRVNYESYIASLYLEGASAIGINYPLAIQKLSQVYSQVPNYRDVASLLFNQYVAYGDAWAAQTEYCPAAAQYQTALTILSDSGVSSKLTAAQAACALATPVGAPAGTADPNQTPIAPVGVGG
jgi:hypothetical protein